jgi:hypothetical protein
MSAEGVDRLKSRLGEETWDRWLLRIAEVNRDIRVKGIRTFDTGQGANLSFGMSELVTGYSYNEYYDWDLYFENLYLSHFGVARYCRTNLEVFLDRQLENGFVARTLVNPRWRQHFKPFLSQIALLGCRQTGSANWLKGKYYDRLGKALDYWFWYSDYDHNGLCSWDSADASGMDNQDRRAGKLYSQEIEGTDLNSYLIRECRAHAVLADLVGRGQDANRYRDRADSLARTMNEVLWDAAAGFYFDRNERTGERVTIKSAAGLLPLWAGIASPDRARRLVEDHLTNPMEFWLEYPVACWSKDEPDYYQQRQGGECNWRGTCWVPVNYMLFHGLIDAGYRDLAGEVAYRTCNMASAEETTREYYNAETGCGQGLNPFWGWSALAYLMPLEFELGHDPTVATPEKLASPCRDLLGLAFPPRECSLNP